MQPFTQIRLRNMSRSLTTQHHILRMCDRLGEAYPSVMLCRVEIEGSDRASRSDPEFQVSLAVRVPGREIVATNRRSVDLFAALRRAFASVCRELVVAKTRGE
jgi:ribosome-associated translation inhibitor RaiA